MTACEMTPCEPRLQQLERQSSYRQAVQNLKSDCLSAGNPTANIPVEIEQAMKDACASKPDKPFTEIVEGHQTIRQPDAYTTRNPPGDRPLRRVVTLTDFLNYHLLSGPGKTKGPVSNAARANQSTMKAVYRKRIESQPSSSLESELLLGTTGELDTPSWWTFLEVGRQTPDAATYAEELMLDQKTIDAMRREGGVVISIPAWVLAGQTYKPCALDAFEEDTWFRPDHSDKPYGMTHPTQPGLNGHPELISPSVPYSKWQSRLKKIEVKWLAP